MKRRTVKKQLFSLGVLLFCLEGYCVFFDATVHADPGWIQVLNPSEGTWYTADTMYISWSSQNAGNVVDIQLYVDGALSLPIASNVPNSGSNASYNWLIPSGIPTSSSCRIKITSRSNYSIYDFSGYFSLNNRYITMNGPNPGVVWYGGEAHTISWSSQNVVGSIRISLYDSGTHVMDIAQNIPCSQGNYLWEIPTTIASGTSYRIHIEAQGYSGISDFSGSFSIKKRSIMITAPSKDSLWYLGGIYQITWVSEASGDTVDIQLYEKKPYEMNFYFSQSIIMGTDNDGRQTWTVPSSLAPDSSYRIYIVSPSYTNVFNYSQTFHLVEQYIRVSSPGEGIDWYIGETYTITWTSQNAGDLVNIVLYQNGVQKAILVENLTNNGLFNWSVPVGITPSDSSQIKVQCSTLSSVYGISEQFSVSRKSIEITTPGGTDLWYKGDQHLITWGTKGFSSNVRIELVSESARAMTIASNVANSGRYEWTVPLEVSSGSLYQIKIISISDESIYGYSQGHFAIESTFVQQWTGTIVLFTAVAAGFTVAYIMIIRKWRRRIASEEGNQESEVMQNIPEQLSDEEYENIWEKNRD